MTARALALLAAFASPVFMVAAIVGWVYEIWPATPLTLAIAATAVVGGPVLGIVHVAGAEDERAEEDLAPRLVPRPERDTLLLTPRAARARAFHTWRQSVHPAIERRERERRASQWLKR